MDTIYFIIILFTIFIFLKNSEKLYDFNNWEKEDKIKIIFCDNFVFLIKIMIFYLIPSISLK